MRLGELVETSNAVTAVSGRREKTERLAHLLTRLAPDEIAIAVPFLSGSLRQGRVGLGWRLIASARVVAPAAQPSLELREVDAAFERIAAASGAGSVAEKTGLLRELFIRATRAEQEFLVRLLMGELRQGALEGVLLEAVARAANVPAAIVRRAAMMAGDLAPVAVSALTEGEAGLGRFSIELMRPVQPMLADSADDIADALDRIEAPSLELKLDGARIQVHKADDEVRIYSRQLREVTPAVPEVVEAVRALPVRDLILDGEVIALREDGTPRPFQETMQRFGRRTDVERLRLELPLTPVFFDLLHAGGQPLIDAPQTERFDALVDIAPGLTVQHVRRATREQAIAFAEEAAARGHEGVMAKAGDAPYAAGRRGQAWLKVKTARTLDLVILAAEWGSGRRQGWLSNLHLGARDPERNGFVMLGKTFKGLTDQMLAWQTEQCLAREIGRDKYTVYVRPELVAEIAFNDVQESPVYPGRLALRFARVKRYRPDKPASEADTFETVQQIYRAMTGKEAPARL
ncbi:MAG TPA: ATP-dependent DNA ligase [Vicinamibacterales bacterium]